MFCGKCGTEVPNNVSFCPNCGNQINRIFLNVNIKDNKNDYPKKIQTSPQYSIELKIIMIISVILQILQIVFWYVETVYVSLSANIIDFEKGASYSLAEFIDWPIVMIILTVFEIAGIVNCILSVVKDNMYKHKKLILSKSMSVINILFLIVELYSVKDSINDYYINYSDIISEEIVSSSFGLTAGGWICVISNIILLILLFVLSTKMKNSKTN